ncbi:MAG: hypothetical protein ACLSH1_08640 [Clostridia bacterium]
MKPFVLYDLINNTEQVILRPERVALYNPPVRKKYSRKRAMKRFLRVVKKTEMGGDHARTTGNIVCIRNPFLHSNSRETS